MSFHVIIPARFQSSRLPGKPLKLIGRLSMIERVCLKAKESGAKSVTVATDHQEIMKVVTDAGFNAVMTNPEHPSGSDRIFEAANLIGLRDHDIIVNVQGDEPFIPSENIQEVAEICKSHQDAMATLCCNISDYSEVTNPNAVKVIFDKNKKAIYFSRSTIPFIRESNEITNQKNSGYYRHIGLYAYTKSFLSSFVAWPESKLELAEKLEQLRTIENGEAIYLEVLEQAPPTGIDTADDLIKANQYVNQMEKNS